MGRRRKANAKASISLAPTSDRPTDERIRHAGATLTSVNLDANQHIAGKRLKVRTQIEWMHSRKQIEQHEFEAAERLFRDYYLGGLCDSGAVDPGKEPVDGGGQFIEPDRMMAARSSFNRAVKVLGPMTRPIVHDVVIENRELKELLSKPYARSGNNRDRTTELRAVLCVGLTELAEHYGYKGKVRL